MPSGEVYKKTESVGYPYRDIVKEARYVRQEVEDKSVKIAKVHSEGKDEDSSVRVEFVLRDMLYPSHNMTYAETYVDTILDGSTQGSIDINITESVESDKTGDSMYNVGGRVFFEGFIIGDPVCASFTYKGFFDDAQYEEPPTTAQKIYSSPWFWIALILLVGGLIALTVYCCCYRKEMKKRSKSKSKSE